MRKPIALILLLSLAVAAQSWLEQAEALTGKGRLHEALPLAEKAHQADPKSARAASLYGYLLIETGSPKEAEPLYRQVHQQSDSAQSAANLAFLLNRLGKYDEAELLYRAALKKDPKSLRHRNNLAQLYRNLGRNQQAEKLLVEVLAESEARLGAHHPDTAVARNNLADLRSEQGRYQEALELYQTALSDLEAIRGESHRHSSYVRGALAGLHRELGEYQEAETLLKKSLVLLPEKDPGRAAILQALGRVEREAGRFARAESYYLQALRLQEEALGADHPEILASRNSLGILYMEIADYPQANELFAQVLTARRKLLGPDHPDTVTSINNLADLSARNRQYEQAVDLYRQVLESCRKTSGSEHPLTATAMHNLGGVLLKLERFDEAERLLTRSLEIRRRLYSDTHHRVAVVRSKLAELYLRRSDYPRAEQLFRQALPMGGVLPHRDLGRVLALRGLTQEALEQARAADELQLKTLTDILSFTSERQRLSYRSGLDPYGLFAELEATDELLQALLRYKGVVLDSLVEDLQQADSQELSALRRAKTELLKRELAGEEAPELRRRVESEEARLARQHGGAPRRALQVQPDQVRAKLEKGEVLLEFFYYQDLQLQLCCAVVVLSPQKATLVKLGPVDALERRLRVLSRQLKRGILSSAILEDVYRLVWSPLSEALPEAHRIFISPAGELNFLSFATLLTPDGTFLGEQYEFLYLASGRDLLKNRTQLPQQASPVAFRAPDFGQATPGGLRASLQSMVFDPLPGARQECDVLQKMGASVFFGDQATEARLRATANPTILHFATHGYIVHREGGNPMLDSGLVLSGAHQTFTAWKSGVQPPEPADDGVLTAQEVGSLQLEGTRLVTLSACDTGSGAAVHGDGVLGLRRGFVAAGVENLVLTLWPVNDKFTVTFMQDFYAEALRAGAAPALVHTQRKWLKQLRQSEGVGPAALLAGPFIVSVQGRP